MTRPLSSLETARIQMIFTELETLGGNKSTVATRSSERLRIAVCIDTRDGPGRERLLGVYEYAAQRAWNLCLVRQDDGPAVDRITEMRVDGAILFDRSPEFHRRLQNHGIFCVETSARNLDLDDAAIFVDDEAVGQLAARHLAGLKLAHFAYCGPAGDQHPSSRRRASFHAHLKQLQLSVDSFAEVSTTGDAPIVLLSKWLGQLPKPVGVLAFDDKIAECLVAAAQWAGLRVPDDVAILGVGNDELICELVAPGISSISVPTREIGRLAAAAIDAHQQGLAVATRRSLRPTEVVVRASSERQLKPDPKIATVVELIRSRAHRPFGTDQIVDAVGIPRRTLERRFLASTGRTVHAFIIDFRVGIAKRLLRRTCTPISEVARQCGYTAVSAFTRMFIERVGCHPEDYRGRAPELG